MITNKKLLDRAEGALLGFAIGDALGWPQERLDIRLGKGSRTKVMPSIDYIKWERRSGGRFKGYREIINPGEYSDDTQLMLSTARSLSHGENWNRYLVRQELPIWLLYMRGAGRSVMSAANSWKTSKAPWNNSKIASNYFSTGANGVAMRILPHALLQDISSEQFQTQVMINGILTHGHPRALLGAKIYALAAKYLLNLSGTFEFGSLVDYLIDNNSEWTTFIKWENNYNNWIKVANEQFNESYEQIWENTEIEIMKGLALCADELNKGSLAITQDFLKKIGAFNKKTNGSGVVAALSAIYVVSKYATNPTSGMLELAFAYGADTDTLTAMAGGLFGALLGTDWIPTNWLAIQDKEYISTLASNLVANSFGPSEGTDLPLWSHTKSNNFLKKLDNGKIREIKVGEMGEATVSLSQNCTQFVKSMKPTCWKLKFSFGQTVYITSLKPAEQDSGNFKQKEKNKRKDFLEELWKDLYYAKPPQIKPSDFIYLISGIVSILEKDKKDSGQKDFSQRLKEKDYLNLMAQDLLEKGFSGSEKELERIVPIVGKLIV